MFIFVLMNFFLNFFINKIESHKSESIDYLEVPNSITKYTYRNLFPTCLAKNFGLEFSAFLIPYFENKLFKVINIIRALW